MQFRWCALIALWTILSGPIMNGQRPSVHSSREPRHASARSPQWRPSMRDASSTAPIALTSRQGERQATSP